ncbi:hypothetical protein D3C76_1304290 [compost metagenome]
MGIDCTQISEKLIIPNILKQFFTRKYFIRRNSQIMQKFIFFRCQTYFFTTSSHTVSIMFNNKMSKYNVIAGIALLGQESSRRRTAHNSLHPVNDFTWTEGLHNVIVCAHLKALNTVDLFAFSCKH